MVPCAPTYRSPSVRQSSCACYAAPSNSPPASGRSHFPNPSQCCSLVSLCVVYVPPLLQVHPEIRRHTEKLRQPQRCTWRYSPTLIHKLIDTLVRNADPVCNVALRQPQRLQELLQQHLTGMGWRTVCGNPNHLLLPSDSRQSPPLLVQCRSKRSRFGTVH